MKSTHLLLAATMAASSLASQTDFGARTHVFLNDAPAAFLADDKVVTWAATVTNQPNQLIGGSIRSNRASLLQANGPLAILTIGRNPWIAQEGATGNYWGLSMEGDWVPLQLAAAGNVTFGQDLCCIDDGTAVHLYQTWKNQWVSETLQSTAYQVIPGRGFMAVIDGTDSIIGFSKVVDTTAVRLNLPANPARVIQHLAGTGESFTRRNMAAFEIATNEIAIYSTYLDSFSRHTLPAPAFNYIYEYDKNTIAVSDVLRNELFVYSAHSGTLQQVPVQDVSTAQVDAQDFGVKILDVAGGNLLCLRAIDGGIAVLIGPAANVTNELFGNNHYTVQFTDSNGIQDYQAVSTSKSNSQFVRANLPAAEAVQGDDFDDNIAVVGTDVAGYGFSAFTNRWTRLPSYQGNFVRVVAEDFIGYLETDSHVYVFSAREDRWIGRAKTANANVVDRDQFVATFDGSSISVYSMNGDGWRTQAVSGTLFLDGDESSYVYSIHDDASTGGSHIWFFQNQADRWIDYALPNRISDPNQVFELEDGLLIMDGNLIHTFSGFPDLSSPFSAPNDNYAYHAFPGAQSTFLAVGEPNAAAFLFVGPNRANINLPGITGTILVDPVTAIGVGAGNYDARGILRLFLPVPANSPRGVLRLQMGGVSNGTLSMGRVMVFEIN